MAFLIAHLATDTFGAGVPPPSDFTLASEDAFDLDFPAEYNHSIFFVGFFDYSLNDTPAGRVDKIGFRTGDSLNWGWDSGGFLIGPHGQIKIEYEAAKIYDLITTGTWRDFFAYILRKHDEIAGSIYNDRLNGYAGDDEIDGGPGDDVLKGGPDRDSFSFDTGDGNDIIKGFSIEDDSILFDKSLAKNTHAVEKAAHKYDGGVILDFGVDTIMIANLKLKHLDKVDFDFHA